MIAKIITLFCASVLYFQSVQAQCSYPSLNLGPASIGNVLTPASNYINLAQGLGCSNNLGFTSYGQTSGVGVASNGLNLANYNIGPLALPETTLTVLSGSPAFEDGGISVVGDNLKIGGNVFVSGAIPFYSAVDLNGNLPSGGQALVSFSAGPLSFGSGGCGQGLASSGGVASGASFASGLGSAGNIGTNYGANCATFGLNTGTNGNSLLEGAITGPRACGCIY